MTTVLIVMVGLEDNSSRERHWRFPSPQANSLHSKSWSQASVCILGNIYAAIVGYFACQVIRSPCMLLLCSTWDTSFLRDIREYPEKAFAKTRLMCVSRTNYALKRIRLYITSFSSRKKQTYWLWQLFISQLKTRQIKSQDVSARMKYYSYTTHLPPSKHHNFCNI